MGQHGNHYLDGNSSIWTNIHGHNHPRINAAIRDQLDRVAHTSFLGFTNEPAIRLAAELAGLFPAGTLNRVFFSDDGSTAIECAVQMALAVLAAERRGRNATSSWRSTRPTTATPSAPRASAGSRVSRAAPVNSATPWNGCAASTDLERLDPGRGHALAAVIIEPLIQGAAGMKLWPPGMLKQLDAGAASAMCS